MKKSLLIPLSIIFSLLILSLILVSIPFFSNMAGKIIQKPKQISAEKETYLCALNAVNPYGPQHCYYDTPLLENVYSECDGLDKIKLPDCIPHDHGTDCILKESVSCPPGEICIPKLVLPSGETIGAYCMSQFGMCYYEKDQPQMKYACEYFLGGFPKERIFSGTINSITDIMNLKWDFPLKNLPKSNYYQMKMHFHGTYQLSQLFFSYFSEYMKDFVQAVEKNPPISKKVSINVKVDSCEIGDSSLDIFKEFVTVRKVLGNSPIEWFFSMRVPQSVTTTCYTPKPGGKEEPLPKVQQEINRLPPPKNYRPRRNNPNPPDLYDPYSGLPLTIEMSSKNREVFLRYEPCSNVLYNPEYFCDPIDIGKIKYCSDGETKKIVSCCKFPSKYGYGYREGFGCIAPGDPLNPSGDDDISGGACNMFGKTISYDNIRNYYCDSGTKKWKSKPMVTASKKMMLKKFVLIQSTPQDLFPACFPSFYLNNPDCPWEFIIDLGNNNFQSYSAIAMEEDIPAFIDFGNQYLDEHGIPATTDEYEATVEALNNNFIATVRHTYNYDGEKTFPNKRWVYQENANDFEEENWNNFTNAYDGNWSSFTLIPSENYLNLSYIKPEKALEAVWQVKPGQRSDTIRNITIPPSCFKYDSVKLLINRSPEIGYFCSEDNGENYTLLFQGPEDSFYEEGMWWNVLDDYRTDYQEDSNSYSQSPSNMKWNNVSKIFDGNWNTFSAMGSPRWGNYNALSIIYKIPYLTSSSVWQIKDGTGIRNLTIPSVCLNDSELKLQVYTHYSRPVFNITYSCKNNNLYSYTSRSYYSVKFYEEAMIWNISLGCIPDCEGKMCGDDGCGRSCGKCSAGQNCFNGACYSYSCTDSDGGINNHTGGKVDIIKQGTFFSRTFDSCSRNVLTEYYCGSNTDNFPSEYYYNCGDDGKECIPNQNGAYCGILTTIPSPITSEIS